MQKVLGYQQWFKKKRLDPRWVMVFPYPGPTLRFSFLLNHLEFGSLEPFGGGGGGPARGLYRPPHPPSPQSTRVESGRNPHQASMSAPLQGPFYPKRDTSCSKYKAGETLLSVCCNSCNFFLRQMRVTKNPCSRVIFFWGKSCKPVTRITAKKKITRLDDFCVHVFTAKKKYTT